jgi:hypothetical protein
LRTYAAFVVWSRRAFDEGEAFPHEAVDTMLTSDIETGKSIPRDDFKATAGFEKLGEATQTPPKSLMRMFSPRGNPQARNLRAICLT